jgi:hypothetical protein
LFANTAACIDIAHAIHASTIFNAITVLASRNHAFFIGTAAGLPTCYRFSTIFTMAAAILHGIIFTYIAIFVLIGSASDILNALTTITSLMGSTD